MRFIKVTWIFIFLLILFKIFKGIVGIENVTNQNNFQEHRVVASYPEGNRTQKNGIHIASDVANLVASVFAQVYSNKRKEAPTNISFLSLNKTIRNGQEEAEKETTPLQNNIYKKNPINLGFDAVKLFVSVLRSIRFDSNKLGALAINGILMVAQAIGSALISSPSSNIFNIVAEHYNFPHQFVRQNIPIDWVFKEPYFQNEPIIEKIVAMDFFNNINDVVDNLNSKPENIGCIKWLICLITPFISDMQNLLEKRLNPVGNFTGTYKKDSLSVTEFFAPFISLKEYRKHGESCHNKFTTFCTIDNIH